jgi:hypothetical protein
MSQSDGWYVMLADGDVHRVTLDQLDEAFQEGHVDSDTLVLAHGADQWTRLGLLAGLDERPPAAHGPRFADPPSALERNPATSPFAPAVPPGFHAPVGMHGLPVTNSFRPVSVDLSELDMDNVSFRGGSGRFTKKLGSVVALLAAIGGVAFVAVSRPTWTQPVMARADRYLAQVGVHLGTVRPTAQAAVAPPIAEPLPAQAPPPAPVAAAAPTPPVEDKAPATASAPPDLGLLTAAPVPPKREGAPASHQHRLHVHPAVHAASKVKSSGFTTGGSKYDPLNSTITP